MRAISTLVLAAAAILYDMPAHADNRYYTGLDCQVAYNEGEAFYSPDDGTLYSSSTSWWRTFVCPIPPSATGISSVGIHVTDNNPNQTMQCRLGFRNGSTLAVSWFNWVYLSGNGNAWLNPSALTDNAGAYFVWCYVPQVYNGVKSGIRGFVVVDN